VSRWDDPDKPGVDNPELTFDVELNLGSTAIDPAVIEATLAILKLQLTDGVDLDKSGVITSDEFTRLFLEASLDIRDYRGGGPSGNQSDGKLTLSELITQSPRDTFVFDIFGGARLLAHGELSFGGLDGATGLSLASVLPSISTDIIVSFGIGYNTLTGLLVQPPEVVLADISLDLGDFIGGFAGDLLRTVGDIIDPLAWLIGPDGLLNFRLPLISDLVGQTVRIRDLVNIFDPENGPKVNAFLDFVETLYFLTDLVEDAKDAGLLNFGDFVLAKNADGSSFFDAYDDLIDKPFVLAGLGAFGGDIRKVPNLNSVSLPDIDAADFSAQSSKTQSFTAGVTQPGSVDFPILKPETIFGLLMGKPATIFTVEFPEFGFEFMYRQVIPIIGPLAATFSGKIGANIDLGFGYDTLGISQFIATENPAYLLNGFFLNDVDPATGFDRPEAIFNAEIAVGAALSLGIATVGVEGGISATIFFNLDDPDDDGKVRFAELAANIAANDGNPIAMFNIDGLIEFFLRAYVEVLFFSAEFEFARLKLFEFSDNFERPGVLATQQGDTLILNIGPNAAGRIQGNTSDIAEQIFVKTVGNESVVVWSDQFNISEGLATTNPFVGVKKIIAYGGAGNDIIDLSGVQAGHGVHAVIDGGEGDDIIIGGGGNDKLTGGEGNDVIIGNGGNDELFGGLGNDFLFGYDLPAMLPPGMPSSPVLASFAANGPAGTNTLNGGAGNDYLLGGSGVDTYIGGPGNDTYARSSGDDIIMLGDAGSIDLIVGGDGGPTLDLSDKGVPVTVFVKDDRILVGFGKQLVSTDVILAASFGFNSASDIAGSYNYFEHLVGVVNAGGVSEIIGSSQADIFHVQSTAAPLTLNGGLDADIYRFYASANAITATVNDIGEALKDENVIEIIGASTADTITVTDSSITVNANQTIHYVPPSDDPNDFTDQLIIKVFGHGGDDLITVASTHVMVPVRVEGGAGNDTVRVGGTTLNNIKSFLNANANNGFGFGPLVLVGGAGHDTVIIDDSADGNNADNVGNLTAFLEKREGIPGLVEVGVVSGLGMKMTVPDKGVVDGHVEFEGFEVVDVRMGTGGDVFTVGGTLNLDSTHPNGGTWEVVTGTDAEVSKGRLPNPDKLEELNLTIADIETMSPAGLEALPGVFGILRSVHTISGMTIVQGGAGADDLRVYRTQDLEQQASSRVLTTVTTQGAKGTTEEVVRLDIRSDVGFFVLEFADPTGQDAVPGAEQTLVLPYSDVSDAALAALIKDALADLRVVGGAEFVDVQVAATAPGAKRSFTITFDNRLGDVPQLLVYDTRLLVAGGSDGDKISVQSIDQPTYLVGGAGQDSIRINVELGVGGTIPVVPPEPLVSPIPKQSTTNGVNDHLTADGGADGDEYIVYLFGGEVNSQINLFDSGSQEDATSDRAIILGTEDNDLFLLRAAVADDGLAFIALLKPALADQVQHVERVNYNGNLDDISLFGLDGDDRFGIDDVRVNMKIYGGDGEDFFQIGQLYKSQRMPAAGVRNADVFATLETTRGFLSNGISSPVSIFGGEGNDEFVVYHNLAPLQLFGEGGDDSFLIRAFALIGSQDNLRERTDVSGGAGADLIIYAVNAPVNIDGGDGFDTVIVIGTEFSDDFVITDKGVFGAGLNVNFVNIESIEVDGAEGDDRFFIQSTAAHMITKVTGGIGSDTFFVNGPTPSVVSNDLLGHTGLISHLVDSSNTSSVFAGQKATGVAANVVDDDEPAIRITVTDGGSVVSQGLGDSDSYSIVLTRKPEDNALVVVKAFAPTGLRFKEVNGVAAVDLTTATLTFTAADWNVAQHIVFEADQQGTAEISTVTQGGTPNAQGDPQDETQLLVFGATKGTFTLSLGALTTADITFDPENQAATAAAIQNAIHASLGVTVTVTAVTAKSFEIRFTSPAATDVEQLEIDASGLFANDIRGTATGFITHELSVLGGTRGQGDTIKGIFVADDVPGLLQGTAAVETTSEGGGGANEVQKLVLDATDGSFVLRLVDPSINGGAPQATAEIAYSTFDTDAVAKAIEEALNGFTGISVEVMKLTDQQFQITFLGTEGSDVAALEVDDSLLSIGTRELRLQGGLPTFITDQGDDVLRGATVKVISGAGIGQVRLVIGNTLDTITVATPWFTPLDDSSRIEILRYAGVIAPTVLVSIVGDDAPALDVRESGGGTFAVEAPQIHGFDGDGDDALGLVDSITVALAAAPTSDVTVALNAVDSLGNSQLYFVVEESPNNFVAVSYLTFTSANWDAARTVYVIGVQDDLVEGLHKPTIALSANGGGYDDVLSTVVVDLWDDEVPGVLVIESGGTTDVIETGHGNFDGEASASVSTRVQGVDGDNGANEVQVLTIAADSGWFRLRLQDPNIGGGAELVTANIQFQKGALATTATDIESALNALPGVTVSVTHEGAPGFGYIGKFVITFTEPAETNVATLSAIAPVLQPVLVLNTADQAPAPELATDHYQVVLTRAPQGTATVTTEVEGGYATGNPLNPIAEEVQRLAIDATGGTFTLTLRDAFFNGGIDATTAPITYDPSDLDAMAADIKLALQGLSGIDSVDVVRDGNDFIITFTNPADTNVPELRVNALKLTQDETITVNLVAEPTRTQRGGGVWGIRAFLPEVTVESGGNLFLTFDQDNWYLPQTVNVAAVPDARVDGQDSMSFPTTLDLANSVQGPLVITGGVSEDRSADLEREPVMLPGETNFKPSVGAVQQTPDGHDPSFTLTIDLDEIVAGDTAQRTLVNGGAAGIATVTTNTNGAAATTTTPALNEVQVLTIDAAVPGTFELRLTDPNINGGVAQTTVAINYDPEDAATTAGEIEAALTALTGLTVNVEGSASTFFITFLAPAAQNVATLQVVNPNLSRTGAKVVEFDGGSGEDEVQELTLFGNGGTFRLILTDPLLNGGATQTTGLLTFAPDDPQATAAAIAAALNAFNVAADGSEKLEVEVEGSNQTYTITFKNPADTDIAALEVNTTGLRYDEVQTLTINASGGSYSLTLDGGATKTALIAHDAAAAQVEAAIEGLTQVSNATVERAEVLNGYIYTIRFVTPSADFPVLEVVDSTLARTVEEALESKLRREIDSPGDLAGFAVEITRGEAKNKVRLILGGTAVEGENGERLFVLDVNRPWEGGLTTKVPNAQSEFTIEAVHPNLLVDENEETDILYLSDEDSVVSYRNKVNGTVINLPAAQLTVYADQLTGLGMSENREIGGIEQRDGIVYTALEELYITLGRGDNLVVIEDTHRGATTINAGFGEDTFDVKKVSGHTYLHGGPDADVFNVGNAGLLDGINSLLVLTGDVPQVLAKTIARGSAPDPVANVEGVKEIQQLEVHATGGTFTLGFKDESTTVLDFNASAQDMEDALNALQAIQDVGGVTVQRFGAFYRIAFGDEVDVPLITANDAGLTTEGPGDILNIDDSAATADKWAVLTSTSLTGLGMGGFGEGPTYNEIQTLRIDASGGSFKLAVTLPGEEEDLTFQTEALPYNVSGAALDAALEALMLDYLNAIRQQAAADAEVKPQILGPQHVGGGLVEVAQNDDVYVIRFVGLLSNTNVDQLEVAESTLTGDIDDPNDGTAGVASTATRIDGITSEARNEIQRLTIDATGGTFTLAFGDADNKTDPLMVDDPALRAKILLALEALSSIAAGDTKITEGEGEDGERIFDIEFIRELSSQNLEPLIVDASGLVGEEATAVIATVQDGMDTGMNEVQVLTLNATGGEFRLELFIPELEKSVLTLPIAFDAGADDVRRALQHALARALNNLAENADLSRVREAFKTDFTVVKVGSDYLIGFQGLARQTDQGPGVSLLKVHAEALEGSARVVTRMDGISYYGFEQVNIQLGSGHDVLNVQGTSAGSFKVDTDTLHAATNISLGGGNDQVFVSSNADLDHNTIFKTGDLPDVFEFLTGNLDDFRGNLNLDLGEGRHRLLISDEANLAAKQVTISDQVLTPTGIGTYDRTGAAEIQVKGLAKGDITYGVATTGNLFDGVVYWTGYGDDTVEIDGTHLRAGERTTTILNTGLGDDHITVDLDVGEDGFFVLNTMGGAGSSNPSAYDGELSDNDTVRAAASTLPLIIFGGAGHDDIIAGQGDDLVFGDFGRLEYFDGAERVAFLGFGGRGEIVSSRVLDPKRVYSVDLTLGGTDILEGQGGNDLLIGGAFGDFIDGDAGKDLIFGDAVELVRRDVNPFAMPASAVTDPRFQALLGQQIYSQQGANAGEPLNDGVARPLRYQDGSPLPDWAEYQILELFHSFAIEASADGSFGDDYIAGGAGHDMIFGQLGDDTIQGDGSIQSAVGAESVNENRIVNPQPDLTPVYARRVQDGTMYLAPGVEVPRMVLEINPSFEAETDGDDYIEGGGGNDTIFGGLGQDDIIGGSSSLFR
jgi:Ca2+-binding RTX toxin-like protein